MCSRFFLACLPSCYIAGGIYTVMCITARLLWITQQENTAREENADTIEIMQVWEVDTAVNEDVRGV